MQDIGTGQPLLRDSDYNQFFRYQAQSQHGGERDKGGEAQQLSEYGKLPCLVVGNPGKDGLCNAVYHARNRGMSHAVPLVCLRKVTHFPFRIELTQQDGKQIVIDYGEDIRNDYLIVTCDLYFVQLRIAKVKRIHSHGNTSTLMSRFGFLALESATIGGAPTSSRCRCVVFTRSGRLR